MICFDMGIDILYNTNMPILFVTLIYPKNYLFHEEMLIYVDGGNVSIIIICSGD